jgi:branched-chain amino acid transport system substrate-binding protein
MTSPLLPVTRRPAPAQAMAKRYRELFGEAPPPAALYGYEAMRSVLDAIRQASTRHPGRQADRQAVIDAYFSGLKRRSVLGDYSIDAQGDTSAASVGAFTARAGRLRLERVLAPVAG